MKEDKTINTVIKKSIRTLKSIKTRKKIMQRMQYSTKTERVLKLIEINLIFSLKTYVINNEVENKF